MDLTTSEFLINYYLAFSGTFPDSHYLILIATFLLSFMSPILNMTEILLLLYKR